MSQIHFSFLWRYFHISIVDILDVQNEQDDCYVGVNDDFEDNALTGDMINIYQNQSPNVEETNTGTSTNHQQDIFDI